MDIATYLLPKTIDPTLKPKNFDDQHHIVIQQWNQTKTRLSSEMIFKQWMNPIQLPNPIPAPNMNIQRPEHPLWSTQLVLWMRMKKILLLSHHLEDAEPDYGLKKSDDSCSLHGENSSSL